MVRLLFLIALVGGLGFVVFTILQFLFSIGGSKSQRKRDIKLLRETILPYKDNLVPSTLKELELLSINKVNENERGGVNKISTGVFTSIYHEPMIAYARKYYGLKKDLSVTLIRTLESEYIYYSTKDKTEVFVNGNAIGVIHADGNLYNSSNKQLGQIVVDNVLRTHPVVINKREVGEIVNAKLADSPNPRAYEFLENMSRDELDLFKSLTFLTLVEETL